MKPVTLGDYPDKIERLKNGDFTDGELEVVAALIDAAIYYRTWLRAISLMFTLGEYGMGPTENDKVLLAEGARKLDVAVDLFMGKEPDAEEQQVGTQPPPAQQGH